MKAHEIKIITATALPLMAAFLAQKGMQFVDALMMGWIGPSALAAGALGTSTFFVAVLFCMGTLSAVGVLVVRARGANQPSEIAANLQHGFLLVPLLSLPSMILVWYVPNVLMMMGEEPLVITATAAFLHGLVWGIPGFLLFFVLREFVSAFELARIVMMVCVLSIPLTFAANYIFIYGKLGLPAFGIAGIGYASAMIMWLMFLSLFLYAKKHRRLKNYTPSLFWFKFNYQKLKELFVLGVPSGLILVLDVGMFSSAAFMMAHFGITALAAHQVAFQCASVAYAVPYGLSVAIALQVGHAMGANDIKQAKRYAYLGFWMGLIISAVIALFFIFTPNILASIFLNKSDAQYQEINQMVRSFFIAAAIFQCFDATQAMMSGALRGFKDTFIPMLICFSSYWILGIGSCYYLAFHTRIGAVGIWYGLTIGLLSAGVILTLRFVQKSNSR